MSKLIKETKHEITLQSCDVFRALFVEKQLYKNLIAAPE